jgi:hypothetical protein
MKNMKTQKSISLLLLFLASCTSLGIPDSIKTPLYPSPGPAVILKTPTPLILYSSTVTTQPIPSSTPTPFPPEINSLLLNKCKKPWEDPFAADIPDFWLVEMYGDKGCKLPVFSEDKKYLAYVTFAKQDDTDFYVDSVKMINTKTGKERQIFFAHKNDFVYKLEWAPSGELIIWELIWEGPWVIFIYSPLENSIVNTMRLNTNGQLEWNLNHTVVYASHSGEYGADTCVQELRGFDFENNQGFPDFYKIYGIEKEAGPFFGIPYGKNDNLSIEPYGWSPDGKSLWITITLLKQNRTGYIFYEPGPRQAGVLRFSDNGIKFIVLTNDPHFDFSFEGSLDQPRVVSQPYHPTRCLYK